MPLSAPSQAYVLLEDTSHLIDTDADVWLRRFEGSRNVRLALTRDYPLPESVEFDAIFEAFEDTDYPVNDVSWPLMSKRMLETLQGSGAFPHRAIPVTMIDARVQYFEKGNVPVLSGRTNHDFVAVQLTEHLDLFDWGRSDYVPHPRRSDLVQAFHHLVLKESVEGAPPLFRLTVYPTALFVSPQARAALEQAGIKGLLFKPSAEFKG